MRGLLRAVGLALALVLPRGGAAQDLLLGGAVSLREPLTEIARLYEAAQTGLRVDTTFGASSVLAAQLRAGAPIDVFVSADARIVDALAAEGIVDGNERLDLAVNRLVAVERRGLTPPLTVPEDLLDARVRRIAVPEHAVPVGRYAREWLASRGWLARLEPRLVPTEHARATLAAVDAGNADVALVYATDARLARSARLAFGIPEAEQPRIVYVAALRLPVRPAARALLELLGSGAAREVLHRAGFGAP